MDERRDINALRGGMYEEGMLSRDFSLAWLMQCRQF
jgi:hypothetical protein